MISPDQFRVNEVWIAVRVNDEFLLVQNEPYDIYVLLDAASCYVFGHVLSRVVDELPQEVDVKELFQTAFQAKNQWAYFLILTGNSPTDDIFRKEAEKNGLSVKIMNESELKPILGPLKESFASSFMRGSK
ncbi:hypothetical protein DESC_580053 [Desulfosarcina cetonica]|uniref:hypothetical protein n=1 Tax=Desulfosarcina cetonica TaxID=90730 RepID=UPI0006D2A124|nr:hypothetical protein [Desulfosarcina cetonica]VTR67010.1 hypothetical protein DESC_580053 [Desulfosarcina cetonica]